MLNRSINMYIYVNTYIEMTSSQKLRSSILILSPPGHLASFLISLVRRSQFCFPSLGQSVGRHCVFLSACFDTISFFWRAISLCIFSSSARSRAWRPLSFVVTSNMAADRFGPPFFYLYIYSSFLIPFFCPFFLVSYSNI